MADLRWTTEAGRTLALSCRNAAGRTLVAGEPLMRRAPRAAARTSRYSPATPVAEGWPFFDALVGNVWQWTAERGRSPITSLSRSLVRA